VVRERQRKLDACAAWVAQAQAAAAPAAEACSAEACTDLLLSRRTVNDFKPTLPDGWDDALRRAVRAATYAPNHKLTEPWRFHLLGPEAVRQVCELNAELVSGKKGAEAGAKKLKRWLAVPGWLVATCVRSGMRSAGSTMDEPGGVLREDYAACCCAVQNLCLSLHADGIGTKWTTGAVNFDERFAAAAGLPDDEYVVGTIWFGEAEKQPNAPRKRLSVDNVLIRHG
jgi:nitroreductase